MGGYDLSVCLKWASRLIRLNIEFYAFLGFCCDHFVTMILEKYRKKTIKDHNRDFEENLEMLDNRGS